MKIIAASNEISQLVALGFGILSVWGTVVNARTSVRSAAAVLVVRTSCAFDTAVR